jgi:hypothetical protein
MVMAADPSVRPSALQVVWEDDKEAFDGFGVLNTMNPVELALLLDAGGRKLIEVDDRGSKVTDFKDDKGTDLDGEFGPFPKVSEDKSMARFSVRGGKPPVAGAGAVSAKGVVKIRTGSKVETKTSKVVEAKKGATVAVSDTLEFEVTKTGKPDWGDEPFMVEFEIKRDIPEVAAVRFYDADGKEVESSSGGGGRMSFLNRVTVSKEYKLARKLDAFRVETDLWTDMEETEVPFDVTVAVGGAK